MTTEFFESEEFESTLLDSALGDLESAVAEEAAVDVEKLVVVEEVVVVMVVVEV